MSYGIFLDHVQDEAKIATEYLKFLADNQIQKNLKYISTAMCLKTSAK